MEDDSVSKLGRIYKNLIDIIQRTIMIFRKGSLVKGKITREFSSQQESLPVAIFLSEL